MQWTCLPKPAELTENRLIEAILDGVFPIDSSLPGERELAQQLKVTRPTLREALQRLARAGWLEIHHGKPTRVRNYWQEGSLGVLGAIARHPQHVPPDFVSNLLQVRELLAPAYTRLAVERDPQAVTDLLAAYPLLNQPIEDFANFDWKLHYQLTLASGNPIFTLILNGFSELYLPMACQYFRLPAARRASRSFYAQLKRAAGARDSQSAESITQKMMRESLEYWFQAQKGKQTQSDEIESA